MEVSSLVGRVGQLVRVVKLSGERTMLVRNVMKKGCTLAEFLIVVVILGILAAIVIPKFTIASETVQASSTQIILQTVRSQLELYRVQHNGDYPTLDVDNWIALTGKTDQDGIANALGSFGPYLPTPPVNPFTNGSTIGTDWFYDKATGEFKAKLPTTIPDDKAIWLGLDMTNDFKN